METARGSVKFLSSFIDKLAIARIEAEGRYARTINIAEGWNGTTPRNDIRAGKGAAIHAGKQR